MLFMSFLLLFLIQNDLLSRKRGCVFSARLRVSIALFDPRPYISNLKLSVSGDACFFNVAGSPSLIP